MNNVKIVRELIRIAKSLVADSRWNEVAIKNCRKEFENNLKDEGNQ